MVCPLILAAGVFSTHESRTIAHTLPKPTGVSVYINERFLMDGKIVLLNHSVNADGSVNFSKVTYRMDGTPIQSVQEGNWGDRMNRFATDYGPKGAVQSINEITNRTDMPDRTFRDPTKLWFWKTHPKVGESVVVTSLAQNVISTFKIRFTYQGDEEMTLAGRKVTVHRVREDPLGAPGVYSIWWYDGQGMGVKRYHLVGGKDIEDELVNWY